MYDYLIIGGGIAGIYIANKLNNIDNNFKICIIEKTGRLGGRIKSININNEIIESGALRFNKHHKHILKLVNKYDLQIDEEKLEDKKILNISGKNIKSKDKLLYDIAKNILKNKKNNNKTFQEYIEDNYYGDEINIIKTEYSFLNEYYEMNAYSLAKRLFSEGGQYYILKNGYSQIIKKLSDELSSHKNIKIIFSEKINNIKNNKDIFTIDSFSGKKYIGKNLIFAVGKHNLLKIKKMDSIRPILESVRIGSLNRTYAKFTNLNWFPQKNIFSDSYLGQIVPINYEDGLIMITYTSGPEALIWYRKLQHHQAEKFILKKISEILDINIKKIPKPLWIKENYWKNAFHFWNPNFDFQEIEKEILQPFPDENIFIIGEAYSNNQGWADGALDTAENCLKKISDLNSNKKNKCLSTDNFYTLKDVSKHNKKSDAWIILYDFVYDITDWINIHPGGDVIMYGVGKDATELFKRVGHSDDAFIFLEKYRIGRIK